MCISSQVDHIEFAEKFFKSKKMRRNSKLVRSFSILMIFSMLWQVSGCYSSKIIATSNLPVEGKGPSFYKIYDKGTNIRLENPTVSQGILSGKKGSYRLKAGPHHALVNIYLFPDSLLKVINDSIRTPINAIAKVQVKEYKPGATLLLVIPVLAVPIGFLIYELIQVGEAFGEGAQ
jgi:hypothetical protein